MIVTGNWVKFGIRAEDFLSPPRWSTQPLGLLCLYILHLSSMAAVYRKILIDIKWCYWYRLTPKQPMKLERDLTLLRMKVVQLETAPKYIFLGQTTSSRVILLLELHSLMFAMKHGSIDVRTTSSAITIETLVMFFCFRLLAMSKVLVIFSFENFTTTLKRFSKISITMYSFVSFTIGCKLFGKIF